MALHNVIPYFDKAVHWWPFNCEATALTDWVASLALVPTKIPQRDLNPAHTSQHQARFVRERQLFVWLSCGPCGPPPLWVSFSFILSLFLKSLFSWGRQEATETTESFVTFLHQLIGNRTHVSTRHQGDREGWKKRVGGIKKKGQLVYIEKKSKEWRENRTTFTDKSKKVWKFWRPFLCTFFKRRFWQSQKYKMHKGTRVLILLE